MNKVKRNRLRMVRCWLGLLGQTRVTFYRDNLEGCVYYPQPASAARLEKHLGDCKVALGSNYIHLIKHIH